MTAVSNSAWPVAGIARFVVLLLAAASGAASADNFSSVRYDPKSDQIVARMIYRGTNSHHRFSLQWGTCMDRDGAPGKAIEAQVIDDQWNDAAIHNYRSTARFSLMDLHCRPAMITLRSAPRFYLTIYVPAGPTDPHYVAAPQKGRCAPGYQHGGGFICVPIVPEQCDERGMNGGGESSNLAHRCK